MSTIDRHARPRDDDPAQAGRRPGAVSRRTIERVAVSGDAVSRHRTRDVLSTEEPLEIVLAGDADSEPFSVTMRTPGADFDLTAGFLYGDGIIDHPDDILAMRYCAGRSLSEAGNAGGRNAQRYNRVEVRLAGGGKTSLGRGRRTFTTSSCGVCGMGSIESVLALACPTVEAGPVVTTELLLSLPARLRAAQSLFERTGGLHAAALFDADGALLCIREDVGRHNAMDKLVGASLLTGALPLRGRILLLSGRLSFELVQKAARAGVALVAGVSAPSTLAVELAERCGITLVGFLRGTGFNVYVGGGRIDTSAANTSGA